MKLLNGMCVFDANLPAPLASFSKQKSLSIMLTLTLRSFPMLILITIPLSTHTQN